MHCQYNQYIRYSSPWLQFILEPDNNYQDSSNNNVAWLSGDAKEIHILNHNLLLKD